MSFFAFAQTGFTHITDWNSIFGGNVTGEGFYEYDGTYVIPIYKVNWSQGVGDLEGYGLNATVRVSNLNYAINLYWQNITNFPTDISFFNNNVGYITMANVTVYENLSQFINDVGYALTSDLTWNNITGKPTLISYWQNDVGYITMANLTELQQQVQQLNLSLQNESLIRNQTDDMILYIVDLIYDDLQAEILARQSGDNNLSIDLQNLNFTLTQEINNIYNQITSLNNTKSGIGTCPTGFAVQNLTTGSPECVQIFFPETDPIFSAENSTIWNAIWSKLDITDQRYNDTAIIYQIEGDIYIAIGSLNQTILQEIQDRIDAINSLNQTKSGIGDCPAGFVVQNLTTGSPQCVGIVNSETDPIFTAQNFTIWSAIWDRMLITDQRYNDTFLIYQIEQNLYTSLDNLNLTLQQEIIDRSYADNQTNLRIDDLNATKSGIGNCPEGFVVQNLTTGSPECVAILNLETDPIFLANNQSIWDAIALKLDITDQRYNDTALIYLVNDSLMIEIGQLTLDIQNINSSLQQEILDRMDADNSLNLTIIDLSYNLSQEIANRLQNESYILSQIPYVQGDGVYTYNTSAGQVVTIHFNDTKMNQTIEQLTGIFEENVTFSVSGGFGSGQTTQCCSGSVEILEIAVFPTTITNKYKFSANTSITGEVIDMDLAQHTGNWIVAHAGSVVFDEKINYYVKNALIDETFRVRIRWRN